MKNKKLLAIRISSAAIALLSFILKITLSNYEKKSSLIITFYYKGIFSFTAHRLLVIITVMSILTFTIFITKKKWIKNLVSTICVIIFLFNVFFLVLYNDDRNYYYFTSPDGNNELIVDEFSILHNSNSVFYFKKSPFFIEQMNDRISSRDRYRPFLNNDYNIEWKEDSVIITYGTGNAITKKEEIIISLPQ